MWLLAWIACADPVEETEWRSTPLELPEPAETADIEPVVSCTPVVPAEAVVVDGAIEVAQPGDYWACADAEVTVRSEGVNVYLEAGAVAVMRGSRSTVWAGPKANVIVQSSNVTVVMHPRALLGIEATDTRVIYCDEIAYDTSGAPEPGC